MPIYEYLCESCGGKFEKLVRCEDAETVVAAGCPACGKARLKQEYSTFAPKTGSASGTAEMPQCPGGMCGNPGMCGRN